MALKSYIAYVIVVPLLTILNNLKHRAAKFLINNYKIIVFISLELLSNRTRNLWYSNKQSSKLCFDDKGEANIKINLKSHGTKLFAYFGECHSRHVTDSLLYKMLVVIKLFKCVSSKSWPTNNELQVN